jgi:hypothetical protein
MRVPSSTGKPSSGASIGVPPTHCSRRGEDVTLCRDVENQHRDFGRAFCVFIFLFDDNEVLELSV